MGPETSAVVDTIAVDSQESVLEDDYTYSNVDDMQHDMLALSGNPAYEEVPEPSQQPLIEDDQAYSSVDISQQEAAISSGNSKHGTALEAAASAE